MVISSLTHSFVRSFRFFPVIFFIRDSLLPLLLSLSFPSSFLFHFFVFLIFMRWTFLYSNHAHTHTRQDERQAQTGQKWKLPPNGQPICSFSGNEKQSRTPIRPEDDSKHDIAIPCFSSLFFVIFFSCHLTYARFSGTWETSCCFFWFRFGSNLGNLFLMQFAFSFRFSYLSSVLCGPYLLYAEISHKCNSWNDKSQCRWQIATEPCKRWLSSGWS